MGTLENGIWEAAEFITEWNGSDNLRYKLYQVSRDAIDEGSDEPDAYLLHGLDSGNVRRIDELLDTAYYRNDWNHRIIDILLSDPSTPENAAIILEEYGKKDAASEAARSLRAIKSEKRSETSRANGKKGGRPRGLTAKDG